MPNVSQEFIDGPEVFLKKYVVKVADPAGKVNSVTKEFNFIQQIDGLNVATLKAVDGGSIKAHFLRWLTKEVTSMALDSTAKYFFTSQLTNCSFAVFGDPGAPTVYHSAGTIESVSIKRSKERAVNPDSKRERRLSRSGASGADPHLYTGQDARVNPSSAFVYGVFENGTWTFNAQVVAGNLEAYIPRANGTIPKILDPFIFKPWYDVASQQ